MPRHIAFTAGFVATCAIVVPIAWHPLDASLERDGKRVKPLQQEFEIDGTRVTLDVDHNLVLSGGAVNATLRAYSDKRKQIAVDLEVLRSNDLWGSRVAGPERAIDREHFLLTAAPGGGKPVTTRLVLGGDGQVNTFKIMAMPRTGAVDSSNSEIALAAQPVLAWHGNDYDMAIETEGKLVAGKPFTVAVRMKNTTNQGLLHIPSIRLGTEVGLEGVEDGEFTIEEIEPENAKPRYERELPVGRVFTQRFTVTPKSNDIKQVTLVAEAFVYGQDISPVEGGAMEAQTIHFKPAPRDKVAAK